MTINTILLGVISVTAFTVITYWWSATRGTWMRYPAGWSLMGLLGIIAVGFGFGVVNQLLGQYPARPFIGFGLYALFVGAIVVIGFTIRAEMKAGKKRLRNKHSNDPKTGPVIVTVAERNEENDV